MGIVQGTPSLSPDASNSQMKKKRGKTKVGGRSPSRKSKASKVRKLKKLAKMPKKKAKKKAPAKKRRR